MSQTYDQLIAHQQKLSAVHATMGLLGWDQETMMPPGGLVYRGEQLAQVASIAHELATSPRIAEWLAECESDIDLISDPTSGSAVNLREIRRDYDRNTKLPAELVAEVARVTSAAKAAWQQARKADDFGMFEPHLQKVIDLNIAQAECYGWAEDGEAWDALAEGYEAGMNAAYVQGVFGPLRQRLVAFTNELLDNGAAPSAKLNDIKLPIDAQMRYVRMVSEQIGFDYSRGRLDVAAHPFCGGTHCHDVRLTTRFHEDMLTDALGSTMHEAGHGMYEQGLPADKIGQPAGDAVGLSIHESQSRLWENHVGRSRGFWQWAGPKLGEYFGDAVAGAGGDDAYAACNVVQRSLIRVEADEVTYHLHILIRFELERLMARGELGAADVPEAWNSRYHDYLGVEVPGPAAGCMQDIHWSMGSIGYFPTYTLGSLYAAQFYETACNQLGDVDAMFARGEFTPLRRWLNENIHALGKTYRSEALCEHVTGSKLSADPFMRHVEGKLRPLYGL